MAEVVAHCPRCGAKHVTFDVPAATLVRLQYGWHHTYEAFAVCRHCRNATIFILEEKTSHGTTLFKDQSPVSVKDALNKYFSVPRYISLRDHGLISLPEHLPETIVGVFVEGATSISIGNWNAAGAMFRACIDLATRPLLPQEEVQGLNRRTRRDLGLRLPWLFENDKLPPDLRELSSCIREDGNDGVHQGTLTEEEARDLLDFTTELLRRLFTEPMRLQIARERREQRRAPKQTEDQ